MTAAEIDRLLADGSLVVGWLMRGTLHLVPAEDYRWLLGADRSRVGWQRTGGGSARKAFRRTTPSGAVALIERVLADEGPLTRCELASGSPRQEFERRARRRTTCLSSPRCAASRSSGRYETERRRSSWPATGSARRRRFDRDVALAELARRYLAAHAPATPTDLARWSGLPLRDTRRLPAGSTRAAACCVPPAPASRGVRPLPPRLEGPVVRRPRRARPRVHPGGGVLRPIATVGGEAAGTWTRRGGRIEIEPFSLLRARGRAALAVEAEDIVRFAG